MVLRLLVLPGTKEPRRVYHFQGDPDGRERYDSLRKYAILASSGIHGRRNIHGLLQRLFQGHYRGRRFPSYNSKALGKIGHYCYVNPYSLDNRK